MTAFNNGAVMRQELPYASKRQPAKDSAGSSLNLPFISSLLAACSLMFAAPALLAQESEQETEQAGPTAAALAEDLAAETSTDLNDQPIEEVTVVGRWENLLGKSMSASAGVFGQTEIAERPILRTGEIMELVPGMIMTQHSGSGKSNQMFLRGFNLDHGTDFATWVDGMPVNMRTHGHGQGYTDVNFMIEELVNRVAFNKGPYDASVSDFSSAGAARFQTARDLDQGIAKVTGGQYGYRRVLLADSFNTGQSTFVAGVEAKTYDGPWEDISEDLKSYKGLLRASREAQNGDVWEAAFMGYDASWNSADQIPRRAVEQGIISDLGSLDTTVGGETSRYSLSGSWTRDTADSRWQARAYAISYDMNLLSNFTYFANDPVNGDQFQQIDDRNIYGGDLTYSRFGSAFGKEMAQTFGVETRYDDIKQVALNNTVDGEFLSNTRADKVKQASIGAYYENEYRWTSKLRSVVGIRADFFDFDVASNLDANSGKGDDSMVSPKINLIYDATEDTELYFSAGTGMHSNDARGVTITEDPVTGDPADPVDPLVRSKGAEVGTRSFLTDRLNVSVAVWYLELDSELLFVGDAGTTEAQGPSERYGVEIPLYYQTDFWKFDLELAFTHSEFSETGEKIPGALDRVIAAGAYFEYPMGIYGSARVRHFGERPLIEDGSVESDPTTVVNGMLGYKFAGNWDFRLEALNLFDSSDDDITYFYESQLATELNPVADVHFKRVEPRSLRASLSYTF